MTNFQRSTSEARLEFANRHGIEKFLFARECFEIAPLAERTSYWDDLLKVIVDHCHVQHPKLTSGELDPLLRQFLPLRDITYHERKSIVLLPPPYDYCPLNCEYIESSRKRKLVGSQHEATKAVVFDIDGSCRDVSVLKRRCRGCNCVLEYDMLYISTRKGYQFYTKSQPTLRVTPTVYFSRALCEHIVATMARGRQSFDGFADLWIEAHKFEKKFDRKWVSTAWYRHEVEAAIRSASHDDPRFITTLFSSYNSFDEILPTLEKLRMQRSYKHIETAVCQTYLCNKFQIMDGLWSLNHPHCAAPMTYCVLGFPKMKLPPICPNQPVPGSMYCQFHHSLAAAKHQPFTKEQMDLLRRTITPADMEIVFGTPDLQKFLTKVNASNAEELTFNEFMEFRCSKNLGERKKKGPLSKTQPATMDLAVLLPNKCPRSRGILITVRPCGQIMSIVPIYRSESPAQVFLSAITTLHHHVMEHNIPSSEWKNQVVIFDNMCNVDRTLAAKNPLPLPPPFDKLWMEPLKVIDVFHIRNHKRPECKTTYHPKNIRILHPTLPKRNTQAAEQTNSFFKRFVAVLNAIPRDRQLFYIDRLAIHRNEYLASKHGARSFLYSEDDVSESDEDGDGTLL